MIGLARLFDGAILTVYLLISQVLLAYWVRRQFEGNRIPSLNWINNQKAFFNQKGAYKTLATNGQINNWINIPANAENVELAHEFINYACSYEAAMDNSSFVGYTSANQEVMDELASGDYEGINAYVPRTGNDKDEVFEYDEATRKIISDYFSKVKIAASNAQ